MFIKQLVSRTRTDPEDKLFYRKKTDRLQKLSMCKAVASSTSPVAFYSKNNNTDTKPIIFITRPTEENPVIILQGLCVKYSIITIDWGDGKVEAISTDASGCKSNISHTYKTPNENYLIQIFPHIKAEPTTCSKPYFYIDAISQIFYIESFGQQAFDFHTISICNLPLLENFNPYMLYGLTHLEHIIISNTNITFLPYYLLLSCSKLKTATFSGNENLIDINESLLVNCNEIESVSFHHCSHLSNIPALLFKNKYSLISLRECFDECSITAIPEDLLLDCVNLKDISYMFSNNSLLLTIPERLFNPSVHIYSAVGAFSHSAIKSIPEKLFRAFSETSLFNSCFEYCYNLTFIPDCLFDNCISATDFSNVFAYCNNLTEVPEQLFKNCKAALSYSNAFINTKVINIPPECK